MRRHSYQFKFVTHFFRKCGICFTRTVQGAISYPSFCTTPKFSSQASSSSTLPLWKTSKKCVSPAFLGARPHSSCRTLVALLTSLQITSTMWSVWVALACTSHARTETRPGCISSLITKQTSNNKRLMDRPRFILQHARDTPPFVLYCCIFGTVTKMTLGVCEP
jgi:hypothetical protein